MTRSWDRKTRSQLEEILSQGYGIAKAAEILGISHTSIRTELRRSLTKEEYKDKRYNQYRATKATLTELFEGVPDSEIRKELKKLQAEARRA